MLNFGDLGAAPAVDCYKDRQTRDRQTDKETLVVLVA